MIDNLFLSVGAMKAGTTWLYEQLKDHPDIYFTPEKEIHYFANKVGIEKQLSHRNRVLKLKHVMEQYAKGNPKYIAENVDEIAWYANYAHPKEITNEWYESLFAQNLERKFCADFSNLYCQMDIDGWENVNKVAEDVKVIYTLRDPLSRLWSHYKFHMKWVNREDEALEAGFRNFKETLNKHWFWVNAEYAENYKRLRKNLSDDQLMILHFEDFRENPQGKLAEVLHFLGLDFYEPDTKKMGSKINKTKDFSFPEEWADFAAKKLAPIYEECEKIGLSCSLWNKR